MTPLMPLLTAFATGFGHALAPDHVAAVGTLVSRRPGIRECARLGARWGLGHSASVLLAGGIMLGLDLRVSGEVAQNLERAVGVMLVGLGAWLLWSLAHERAHRGRADHPLDRRGSFLVGMAHGLAGTAPLIGVLPLLFIPTREAAALYLLLFSAGTIAAMSLFAALAGLLLSAAGRGSQAFALTLRFGAAVGSVVLGVVWFARV